MGGRAGGWTGDFLEVEGQAGERPGIEYRGCWEVASTQTWPPMLEADLQGAQPEPQRGLSQRKAGWFQGKRGWCLICGRQHGSLCKGRGAGHSDLLISSKAQIKFKGPLGFFLSLSQMY